MQNIKKFTFLPNGKPVAHLKNEAKKLHKSGQIKGLTNAQNFVSKKMFNKSFNKLSKDLDSFTPFIKNKIQQGKETNTLFLPILCNTKDFGLEESEDFLYYIAINKTKIVLSGQFIIDIEEYTNNNFITDLKIKQLELINDEFGFGWLLHINSEHFIKVTRGCEGISVDLYHDNSSGFNSLDSNYIYFNEMLDFGEDYSIFHNQNITDYKAAYLLNTENDSSSKYIMHIAGVDILLLSTWSIEHNGNYYNPKEMISYVKVENIENEFWQWLHGRDNELFENYHVETAPYFVLNTEDGDMIGEVFDEIPKTLTEKCLMVLENLI